jgi:hypothetical protein
MAYMLLYLQIIRKDIFVTEPILHHPYLAGLSGLCVCPRLLANEMFKELYCG